MSLIQEALEKIQENRFGKVKRPVKNDVFLSEETLDTMEGTNKRSVAKASKNKPRLGLLVAGVAVASTAAALIFALIFFRNQAPIDVNDAAPSEGMEVKQNVIYRPTTVAGEEASSPSPTMPKLILNGIMYIEGRPRAIINGFTVMEGNSVSGAVVREIREDSVVLNTRDIEITIDMD